MTKRINRRNFARLLGLSASVAALPATGIASSPAESSTTDGRGFSKGFLWGTATSAYQIEGAPTEDGRGPSIWDAFSHVKTNTYTGDNGDMGSDHFHRYREDIALMQELGVQTYQFSVSWSRIFPEGTGAPNPKGWDFYDHMLDTSQTPRLTLLIAPP